VARFVQVPNRIEPKHVYNPALTPGQVQEIRN
jgi:hypothetical protein